MKFQKIFSFLILLFFYQQSYALHHSAESQASSKDFFIDRLEVSIERALHSFAVPGAAVGIIKDGEVILLKGFGLRDRENRLKVTDNTIFPICSLTKAFTAAVLEQLVLEGRIRWDDSVVEYLPEFRLYDERTHLVTVRDLLSHQTGLPRHDMMWYQGYIDSCPLPCFSTSGLVERLWQLEPTCGLREQWQYNNLMYAVASLLVERVTLNTWEDEVSWRIFNPLGMVHSNFTLNQMLSSDDHANGHGERANRLTEVPFFHMELMQGAAAINSTAGDMVQWMLLQLSYLYTETHRKQISLLKKDIREPWIKQLGYGLGWYVGDFRGHKMIFHGGDSRGFSNYIVLLPEKKIGIVILSNREFPVGWYFTRGLANQLLDQLLGYSYSNWLKRTWQEARQARNQEIQRRKGKYQNSEFTVPSHHDLSAFVGHYKHPTYGTWSIVQEECGLVANYYTFQIPLDHVHHDVFEGSYSGIDYILYGKDFMFLEDAEGKIDRFLLEMEPTLPPMEFLRIESDELDYCPYDPMA